MSCQPDHKRRKLYNELQLFLKTEASWRFLLHNLPPQAAVYKPIQRWLAASCFIDVTGDLLIVLRLVAKRDPELLEMIKVQNDAVLLARDWRAGWLG